MKYILLLLCIFLVLLPFIHSQTDDTEDEDDDCAFISGQHCDNNGICKYCAMCLQSSCILSKSIGPQQPTCNATQFGTTNLYNWYDYCLSSDNDSSGDYCATSTECYQYRKSVGPSVTYAWHNLTCNPSTCMLVASNGSAPPTPLPPSIDVNSNSGGKPHGIDRNEISNAADNRHHYRDKHLFRNPAAIALTVVCSLIIIVFIFWLCRLCKKKGWWPYIYGKKAKKERARMQQTQSENSITSTVPSSAPPSFSSTPPDMAIIRHPHLQLYQPTSARSSTGSSSVEPLPSYLTPYPLPPKYEQAIVTQIRDLRDDTGMSNASSSTALDQYHQNNTAPLPSMWVPVYFTQQQTNFRRSVYSGEVIGFTPNHSYWLQQLAPNQEQTNPQQQRAVNNQQEQDLNASSS